jgi:hypothetical protein
MKKLTISKFPSARRVVLSTLYSPTPLRSFSGLLFTIFLSVCIVFSICVYYSFADVPCKINYQGRLIENNVPVDGTKTMKFTIYDSAVGGDELWTSGNVDITVYNGLFRYVLGEGFIDGSPVADLSSLDWTAGQELYLQVIVDGEPLTPLEAIYAYPYAINSHLLEGATKEYFLNTSGEAQTKQGDLNIMGNIKVGETAYFNTEYDNGNSGTADTIDWRVANKQKSTLTGNVRFTFIAPYGPCNLVLKLVQDGTGSRSVTWPATVKWAIGTKPTLTTTSDAIDIVSFYYA